MTANNEDVKIKSREKVCAYRELKLGVLKLGGAVSIFTELPRRRVFSESGLPERGLLGNWFCYTQRRTLLL